MKEKRQNRTYPNHDLIGQRIYLQAHQLIEIFIQNFSLFKYQFII